MVYRDPKCVYVTDSPGNADVVANLLEHEGILAKVMDRSSLGGLLGLTIWSTSGVSSRGLEVWVVDESHVADARNLLAKFEAETERNKQRTDTSAPIDAQCEDCGETTTFTGNLRGSVQDCPHCGEYMDVPGGDDDFDWTVAESEDFPP